MYNMFLIDNLFFNKKKGIIYFQLTNSSEAILSANNLPVFVRK